MKLKSAYKKNNIITLISDNNLVIDFEINRLDTVEILIDELKENNIIFDNKEILYKYLDLLINKRYLSII